MRSRGWREVGGGDQRRVSGGLIDREGKRVEVQKYHVQHSTLYSVLYLERREEVEEVEKVEGGVTEPQGVERNEGG